MMNNIRTDVTFFKRSIKRTLLLPVVIYSSSPCGAWHPIDIQDVRVLLDPPHIQVKGSTLFFDGKIDDGADAVVIELIKKNNIKTLSINSIGGSVEPAMNIGLLIHQRNIDIVVRSVCASACANYLFPAGNKKTLNSDSYLLWHGSAHSPAAEFIVENNQGKMSGNQLTQTKEFQALAKKELTFYQHIGVEYTLPVCPQRQKDYHQRFPEKWFSYSQKDLAAFGVNNIFYAGGEDNWQQLMKKNGVIFADHCREE